MTNGLRPLAELCMDVCYADFPAFCSCGVCWRSNCSHSRHRTFCDAAIFPDQPFNYAKAGGIQTDLSRRLAKTFETRTKCAFGVLSTKFE